MDNVLDRSWVKSAFLLPVDSVEGGNETVVNRIYSTSMASAADTTLGGSYVLNPLPQFTRYADLKHNIFSSPHGRGDNLLIPKVSRHNTTNPNTSNGMGRVYSEKFYDNMQIAHFRVGVPEYNSMTSFYANYYSVPASTMARRGRAPGFFYNLGRTIGTVASMPLMPFVLGAKTVRFFLRRPASKYYYLKPTMVPYWGAVSAMVNGIAANMGIIPRPVAEGVKSIHGPEEGITQEDVDHYHKLIPNIYRKTGGIDVFRVAQRGQQLVNLRRELLSRDLDNMTGRAEIKAMLQERLYGKDMKNVYTASRTFDTYEAYAEAWYSNTAAGHVDFNDQSDIPEDATPVDVQNAAVETTLRGAEPGFFADWMNIHESEGAMGSNFVSLRVDFTGSQSESFSNSVKEPAISSQINSVSASAREARFALFDGNVETSGLVGGLINSVKDVLSGAMEGLGVQGLAQLAGSAFADIPKIWDSSSADFNKMTLNVPLRSPYGDPMSRLQNIILPLSSILAMGLPLATGKQSHTSPFILEYFIQGRAHSRLAIIDSITVTRGVGDIGWNNEGGFLGCDVQIGLLDLSSTVNIPLMPAFDFGDQAIQAAGYGIGAAGGFLSGMNAGDTGRAGMTVASALLGSTYDDDNNYSDYLAILAGLPLEAEINPARKWALRLAKQQARFDDATSKGRLGMMIWSTRVGELAKGLGTVVSAGPLSGTGTDRQ